MTVPAWLCIPFVGLLACVAVMPLILPEWWERNEKFAILGWSLLEIVLYALVYGAGSASMSVLDCFFNDYLTFIVLLFGLYCVSGNIRFEGDAAGSPGVNTALLAIGTFLASCIGTTGATMLMIRPVIYMNSWRRRRAHIMIFFIFMISNLGGCLTPIGDPPILMGFMRGVPFFWSLKLFPIFLFNLLILLGIFYLVDRHAYRKDVAAGLRPDISKPGTELLVEGAHNLLFMAVIAGAVVLSGVLPGLPLFQTAEGTSRGIPIGPDVVFPFSSLIEVVIILAAAFLSFRTTPAKVRRRNHFTWNSIREVAMLFIGIFITMQPALALLRELGPTLGLTKPAEMFWTTGLLSSFLDNTPTYLVFLTTTGALSYTEGVMTSLGTIPVHMLEAISCGAVFMGANSYIGNAPNFMVKSMADENGIRMPSFFGYLKWSFGILVPVFLLDTLLFFRA